MIIYIYIYIYIYVCVCVCVCVCVWVLNILKILQEIAEQDYSLNMFCLVATRHFKSS